MKKFFFHLPELDCSAHFFSLANTKTTDTKQKKNVKHTLKKLRICLLSVDSKHHTHILVYKTQTKDTLVKVNSLLVVLYRERKQEDPEVVQ